MFQSRNAKIALAVFLVVVLGLAAYFYFRGNGQKQEETDKRIVSDDEVSTTGGSLPQNTGAGTSSEGTSQPATTLPGQSPVASSTAATASATITPYPNSGVFDWTREEFIEIKNVDPPALTTKQIEQLQNNDLCGFANISDSWSDPFEKVLCNLLEFTVFNIIEPLERLICDFNTVGLNLNYDQNIKSKYENGQCLIEDR